VQQSFLGTVFIGETSHFIQRHIHVHTYIQLIMFIFMLIWSRSEEQLLFEFGCISRQSDSFYFITTNLLNAISLLVVSKINRLFCYNSSSHFRLMILLVQIPFFFGSKWSFIISDVLPTWFCFQFVTTVFVVQSLFPNLDNHIILK